MGNDDQIESHTNGNVIGAMVLGFDVPWAKKVRYVVYYRLGVGEEGEIKRNKDVGEVELDILPFPECFPRLATTT